MSKPFDTTIEFRLSSKLKKQAKGRIKNLSRFLRDAIRKELGDGSL